jgi:3'(2'), 5'-bisphosphate nucleotidase
VTLNSEFGAAEAFRLLDELTSLVSSAAAAVLAARAGPLDVRTKPDRSPVTAADEASEAVLLEGVARLVPQVPTVSEERIGHASLKHISECAVLIDPLDGTRELVAGRDEFTVNLAVAASGRPVLGIIAAPALGLIWRGAEGHGAERLRLAPGAPAAAAEHTPIRPRPFRGEQPIAVVSRSHLDAETVAFLARRPGIERLVSGSAIKFCRVAEGAADVYPRLAPVREWDRAAGHAIVAATGGLVTRRDGAPLVYGQLDHDFLVPGFIAWGDPAAPAQWEA